MNSTAPCHLVQAVEDVLRQGQMLLSQLDSETYCRKLEKPYGASLGGHYRHVLDHFSCLLAGVSRAHVNYDSRQRNPQLEIDVAYAMAATEMLIEDFRALPEESFQRFYTVAYSVGYSEEQAQTVSSTLGREIAFSVGHAIHHYAIMRLLCAQLNVAVPEEFGFAPSTLKYQRAAQAH